MPRHGFGGGGFGGGGGGAPWWIFAQYLYSSKCGSFSLSWHDMHAARTRLITNCWAGGSLLSAVLWSGEFISASFFTVARSGSRSSGFVFHGLIRARSWASSSLLVCPLPGPW